MATTGADVTTLPSILGIEAACLSAWPAVGTVHDGAWIWRFAHGYSKRSNSFQSLDPEDDDEAERRIAYLASLSTSHGIEPVFRVTPLAGPRVLDALNRAGWQAFEESRVLVMDLEGVEFEPAGDVRFFEPTDPRWYRAQSTLSQSTGKTVETLKILLGLIAPEARGVVVYAPDGTRRGWYANVTFPSAMDPTTSRPTLFWHDLYLDVIALPDGTILIRDEDELDDAGLAQSDPDLHRAIIAAKDELVRRFGAGEMPFGLG